MFVGLYVEGQRENNILEGHSLVDPLVIKYINRLSDLIYALARYLEEEEIAVKYED